MTEKEKSKIKELLNEFNNRKSREADSINIESFIDAVESASIPLTKRLDRQWDDISYMTKNHPLIHIDKRSNYVIHISNGCIRYDFKRFDSWADAVEQEYHDFGPDAAKKAMECCISTHMDAVEEWNKWIKLGFIDEKDYWDE